MCMQRKGSVCGPVDPLQVVQLQQIAYCYAGTLSTQHRHLAAMHYVLQQIFTLYSTDM